MTLPVPFWATLLPSDSSLRLSETINPLFKEMKTLSLALILLVYVMLNLIIIVTSTTGINRFASKQLTFLRHPVELVGEVVHRCPGEQPCSRVLGTVIRVVYKKKEYGVMRQIR